MTYLPNSGGGGLPDITTTAALSGRQVNGVATNLKLVIQSGNLSTGNTSIAHGITDLDRVIGIMAWCLRDNGAKIIFPFASSTSTFVCSLQIDATDIIVGVGTSWTGAGTVLSNLHTVIEYTTT